MIFPPDGKLGFLITLSGGKLGVTDGLVVGCGLIVDCGDALGSCDRTGMAITVAKIARKLVEITKIGLFIVFLIGSLYLLTAVDRKIVDVFLLDRTGEVSC